MRRILFAGLSLLLILGAKAQYTITNYASMNEIYCFAEEGNFIWVGTSGGLQKRLKGNGALVSTYTTSNSDLVSNNIRDIHVDPTGAKWIGTFGGGVQKLSGTTWESFNAAQGSAGNLIMDISEDLSGSYWIGTLWYQVIRYNGTMWSHYDNSNGFNANIVYQSLADDFGNVWFATDSGLVKFDINGVFSRLDPTNSNLAEYTVECLAKDNNGNLWIAPSGEGLQKYDILGNIWTTYTTIDGLPSNYVRCMTTDVSGGLWLGTSYGVSRFDGVSSFTNYNTVNTPQFEYNNIWALMTDAEGNLWVGSEEGLLKYTQNTATWSNPMKISNTIKNNQVYDYAQDMNGNHWFATWKGVSKFDGVNWRNYTNADGLGNSNVNAVAVDAHNNKWVGTAGNGATKIDSTNTVFTVYNSGNSQLLQNDVEDIAIDINGNIWFANRNNGLVKFIPSTNTWKTYGLSFGLPTLELLCLAIDQNNDIWVGTGNKGISKFNATNETFENHNASTDFNDVWVYDIDINENNLPVVACNWGLYEFDGSIWNELASLYTPAVMVDSSGYYWYGHSGYYWMGVTKTKDFTTTIEYTTLSGLVDYNIQEIGMDRDNNRWICTGSGISKLTYQAPLVTFTNDSACLPAPICFSNTSTGADAFTDWEWDINGDGSVEYTTPSMSHSFDVSGTYYVKLTGTNEGIPAEYVLPVVVRDIPMVFVSSDPGLSVCSGEEVVLTAHAGSFSGIEWSEDFTGDTLFPTGWTVEGTSTANWDVKPTTHAGGQANELEFFYNPQFFGHSKVITSVIDLSGMPSAALSFVYAVDYYENSFDIGIVFSNDGVSWDTTWKETVSADVSPRSKTISIPPAFLTSTARFAIYFSGNSYDADYIYFDNFSIGGFDEITPLVEEHFSGSALPTGWTAGGEGVSNWKTSSTSNAGGDSPELMLDWSPQFIGSARYASPAINTTGLPEVTVIFNQAVDNYSGSFQIGLATSSDGTTWTPVWQQAITQDIPSEVKTVAISNSDVGSANFQFAFFFSGDSYNINYWYIDNV
ncbi:MAG: hypothetical protein KKA07_08205, partial [Bacteroidetes bacterium]|nr:hypothetical protein [Bacteroidota bacterium]